MVYDVSGVRSVGVVVVHYDNTVGDPEDKDAEYRHRHEHAGPCDLLALLLQFVVQRTFQILFKL